MGQELSQAVAVELFLKLLPTSKNDEEAIERTKKVMEAFKPQPAGFTVPKPPAFE